MLLGVQPVRGGKPVRSSSEFDVPAIEDDGIEHAGIANAGSEQLHEWIVNMGSEALHEWTANMGSEALHD